MITPFIEESRHSFGDNNRLKMSDNGFDKRRECVLIERPRTCFMRERNR